MKWILSLAMMANAVSLASGVVTLEGHGYGKNARTFMVESKEQIFYLDKNALSMTQRKALEDLKWNAPVTVTVPITAISKVTDSPHSRFLKVKPATH